MRTRIKICGITRPEDASAAARAGADAIGLVFHPRSPRAVDLDQARAIVAALPAFVTPVAVFMDAPAADVAAVLDALPTVVIQFHGDEEPQACAQWGRPFIKAVPMGAGADVADYARRYDGAVLLCDSHAPGAAGGSGTRFDWGRWPGVVGAPLVLAGGLAPENVREAVTRLHPYGVDVSSGVESAPGIKDPERIARFVREVQLGDATQTADTGDVQRPA